MLQLPEQLKKRVAETLELVQELIRIADRRELSKGQLDWVNYAAAEISLNALITADEVETLAESGNILLQNEIVRCLREIALSVMDVQPTMSEEQNRESIYAVLNPSAYIANALGIPTPESHPGSGDLVLSTPSDEEIAVLQFSESEEERINRLKAQIAALRELLFSLILERDQLVQTGLHEIEAQYMREVGNLEAEVYREEYEARLLKRKLELMRARVNREEPICEEEINESLRGEYEAYQVKYRIYVEKVHEAAEAGKTESAEQGTNQNANDSAQTDEGKQGKTESADKPQKKPESPEAELKRLYRKIVKAMHPDLHPVQDEATKALFRTAIVAYKDRDLKKLREIAAIIDGEKGTESESVDLLTELNQERQRLLDLIRGLRNELDRIKTNYPYTLKAILDDPEKLKAKKVKLKKRIDNARKVAEVCRQRIEEMMRQHG